MFRTLRSSLLFPVLVWLQLFPVSLVYGQFNGDFAIERHYLDIENFLDWKAYQPPFSWRYEWALTTVGMRASVGSISMYEFYHMNEIRLGSEIGEYAAFYYNQVEDSFFRKDALYQEIEFRIGTDYAVSVIGFPPHDKKYGQMGYALAKGKRYTESYLRLSLLDQYFFYNEKNANSEKNSVSDEYLKTPTFYRMEWQWFRNQQLFLQVDLKQITRAEFVTETPARLHTFEGNGYSFTVDWLGENSWVAGISGYGNSEYRSHQPETATADLPDLDQELLLNWIDIYYHTRLSEKDLVTFGLLQSRFSNAITSSFAEAAYESELTTLQLYGFWQRQRSEWFSWLFSLQAGDADLVKDYIGIEEAVADHTTEIKAGIGIIMMKEGRYRLFCNTTWDLDIFETRQWDGGNVQLQIVF
jgi:hypothetical protein